ncbi:MAG TPA: TonB family protein [Terriglobales bacterium]|nr:TonB family protein [Terriglobales bacterium]
MPRVIHIAAVAVVLCSMALAESSERQVVREQLPEYPVMLKKIGIGGTVRISALVAADGTVKGTKIDGGNPMLAELASSAVKKWKYAAASEQSSESIEFNFDAKLATVRVK